MSLRGCHRCLRMAVVGVEEVVTAANGALPARYNLMHRCLRGTAEDSLIQPNSYRCLLDSGQAISQPT